MAIRTASWASSLARLLAIASVSATTLTDVSTVCQTLSNNYPHQVSAQPLTLNATLDYDYQQATQRYWSAANADQTPACVFFPTIPAEVAAAVKLLNQYSSVPFAVKGGGHNPNVGWSSSKGGLLIALETLSNITLDQDNVAHVGPGARWVDVGNALDPYNRSVATGRLGDVGVPGLTLGGGLSFLSTAHGLTADTVVNYEVVLANGQIVNANSTSNSDLFYALKGGGNQFGIVTKFSLKTFPIGRVWGGTKIYGLDKKDALLNATHNLISNYYDEDAAVIVTFSTTLLDLVDIFVVFYFYNDPNGPGEILAEFDSIPCLVDQTSANRTFGDLLNANSQYSLYGMRYLIRGTTLPNLPGASGLDLYNYTFESFFSVAAKDEFKRLDNFVFSMAFQPVPHQIAAASATEGGNRLGLKAESGDLVFMEYDLSWGSSLDDSLAASILTNITGPALAYSQSKYANVPPTNYQSGDLAWTSYNPTFMNDAMYNQQPLQSYGADTYAKMSQIYKARDPDGFFSRTGGWKFT